MSIESVVNVTITADTLSPERANFGTAMIVAYHSAWADRSRLYSRPADMLTDGFTANSPAYKAALALKAQSPTVKQFKVGRRALAFTRSVKLTPTAPIAGEVYSFTIVFHDGTSIAVSVTADATPTVAEICTAITSALAAAVDVTATDNTTDVDLGADNAGEMFYIKSKSRNLTLIDNTTDPGIATDLAAIEAEDPAFYGVILDSRGKAEIAAATTWVEANKKLGVKASSDTANYAAGSTTDPAYVDGPLGTARKRSAIAYHGNEDEYFGATIMGLMFSKDPGSATWANQNVSGATIPDLKTADKAALDAKNALYYRSIAGLGQTANGKTGSGQFLDITRGIDWLKNEIEIEVAGVIARNDKVPYTDQGVALIKAAINGALLRAAARDFITLESISVTAPLVADVSLADKANRQLPDVEFSATLAGAIHSITINGLLQL